MEKQKETSAAKTAKKEKKATYEELNNYCVQLYNQNKQLVEKLQQLNMANLFKRLDYLFLVIQNKETFDKEFLDSCTNEIKEALSIQNEERKEKEEDADGSGK